MNQNQACRCLIRAYNRDGKEIAVTIIPGTATLSEIPNHIIWLNDQIETYSPSKGPVARVVVDLAV